LIRFQDLIHTYPYHQLVSFGGYHDDFMLTLNRVITSHNLDEPTQERLTFSMPKFAIIQLTMHVADYMRYRKVVYRVTKQHHQQTTNRTPRKSPINGKHL
jgi:hypothetical protein